MDREVAAASRHQATGERIDWCDMYKGIVIILVVVGHATGKFNQYIYQFHMAAFFFISGYTSKVRNHSVMQEAVTKFYKLMVPFYVLGLSGISLFWAFRKAGILGAVSITQYPDHFIEAFVALVGKRTVYCDWLGAAWFLPVLFFASLIFKVLAKLCKRDALLAIFSLLVFCYSMKMAESNLDCRGLDLAGIAQVFLVAGYLAQKIRFHRDGGRILFFKIVLIGMIWKGLLWLGFRNTVDWPSKSFHGFSDLFLPVCGILMTVYAARLLERFQLLKDVLVALGKNSMGIMCFHFIGFKAAYLMLILTGKMQAGEFAGLVPPEAVSNQWWPLIVVTAIACSVFAWKKLYRFSVTRLLLGGGSAKNIYKRTLAFRPVASLKQRYDRVVMKVRDAVGGPLNRLRERTCYKIVSVICAAALLAVFVLAGYGGGKIKVSFPYWRSRVTFESGWFPQGSSENYRWVEKNSEFTVYLRDHSELEIAGYIPDNIANMSYIGIRINGMEAGRIDAACGQQIDIKLDISEYVEPRAVNSFKIEMDGERIVTKTDADQRTFSALINSILIY